MEHQTREQKWALHAYECVKQVRAERLGREYKPLANSLGSNVMRNGLGAALAFLEHKPGAGARLLKHLSAAGLPGLEGRQGEQLPEAVRKLGLEDYMLATHEALRFSLWLRRAVQALLGEES